MHASSVVETLSNYIDDVLGRLIPEGGRLALLDFPNHSNAGDSAIWLGEFDWLTRHGAEIVYSCDIWTYSAEHLRRRVGDGTILLHGGGNLGDLWPAYQAFRERVVDEFPDNRIVQLPQTVHFRDPDAIERARSAFGAHRDLTLLCRDYVSLEFVRSNFAVRSELCPDMAFAIGTLARPRPPEADVLWLARTDLESSQSALSRLPNGVLRTDWLEEEWTDAAQENQTISEQLYWDEENSEPLIDAILTTYERLARERVLRGCNTLSRGRVVITDRLHGHILSLLLGIPHVLLDNSYGKVSNFYRAWTEGSELAHWCANPQEALDVATSLVSFAKST
jgi:exopolysaccharide biosynthesis predicted pyruvyltransferase EpsI